MKNLDRFDGQAGFSVVELLIATAVILILVTFAVLQFGASAANLERQNIAREFKVSLERARFDSVKRRASECTDMARVEITSPTSFRLITDRNQNGTLELATETFVTDFVDSALVEIVADPAPTFPIVLRFDERGNVTSGACGAETAANTPTIFCQLPCTAATVTSGNASIVYVSPTGTVSMMAGGETMPTFAAPNVANMNTGGNYLNPLLAVWDPPSANGNANSSNSSNTGNSNSGNSNSGNSNSGNSNSGNSNSGNSNSGNSNTNTNTSPSPTPRYCISGERPTHDNCVCSPTQYLQGSRCREAN